MYADIFDQHVADALDDDRFQRHWLMALDRGTLQQADRDQFACYWDLNRHVAFDDAQMMSIAGYVSYVRERDALERGEDPDSAPSHGVLDRPFAEVAGDSAVFDRVIRAVVVEADLDYVEAYERLYELAHSGGQGETVRAGLQRSHYAPLEGTLTDFSAMRFDRVAGDLDDLQAAATTGEQVMIFGRSPGEEVDGHGNVKLDGGVDRGQLLTDPAALENAWLDARDSGYPLERDTFEGTHRAFIERGLDYPATLRRQVAEQKARSEKLAADLEAERRRTAERRKRADERAKGDRVAKALAG